MANKLAGQRAKFSRARAIYYTSADDDQRDRAMKLMAEVLAEAPGSGFTEEEVTQGEEVPHEARQLAPTLKSIPEAANEDPEVLVRELQTTVDISGLREFGHGEQSVYAYGYACAPDRLKIGSATGDAVARVAAQISTGTPDRPRLLLRIKTHDCRALERALHGILRHKGKQVEGAGAEWFVTSPDEVIAIYEKVLG